MKWSEFTATQKVFYVIGLVIGIAYLTMVVLELTGVVPFPSLYSNGTIAAFWLCMGMAQLKQKSAIVDFVLAALFLSLCVRELLR